MGIKISNLPAIVTPALSDVFPVVQAGVTFKESFTQLSSLFATAGANTNITSLAGLTTPLTLAQGGTGAALTLPVFNKVIIQKFTATGTYTPTTGMKYCIAEVVGGGGGGGGAGASAGSQSAVGGGGGGGSYGRSILTAAQIGVSQAVTIGAAGAAGANTGGTGGTGGASSLGVLVTTNGGIGGAGTTTAAAVIAAGGDGGAAGTATVAIPGGNGGVGYAAVVTGFSGYGGASFYSGSIYGIPLSSGTTNGTAGLLYGGGGAGASNANGAGASTGGAGAAGIIVITEYLSV